MKGIERMKSQLGGHIKESMGAAAPGGSGALLPPPGAPAAASAQYRGCVRAKDVLIIDVDRLEPDPDQPRKEFDEEAIDELARSLKARGQLQPIRVRWHAGRDAWSIISGERRWRAAQRAGLASLACIEVRGELAPDEILEDQLVENCVREDLRPIEQARAFRALLDLRGCSQRQLAESLNISHMRVSRALALLDLPASVQEAVEQGALPPATAAAVSTLPDPADQLEVAGRIVTEGLTRDQAVEVIKARKGGRQAAAGKARLQYHVEGSTVVVTGDAATLGPAAVAALLRRVARRIDAQVKTEGQGEWAEPGAA